MIRHTFMATTKERTPDGVINQETGKMRAMKDSTPVIQAVTMARGLGWTGPVNVAAMTVGVKDRTGFNALLASPAYYGVANKVVEAFRTDNFVMTRIEP